ncbi:MAG: response regulator [Desulfovibrio sp.]|nr:response regulator [Desulfovibrio sp.]MCA1986857.1 response regulator [Desulfovibrio sp.]
MTMPTASTSHDALRSSLPQTSPAFARTLSFKLLWISVVLLGLFLGLAFVYGHFRLEREFQRELEAYAEAAADRLALSLGTPVWNLEQNTALAIMRAEMHDPSIVAIVVRDTLTQRVFAALGRSPAWEPVMLDDAPAQDKDLLLTRNLETLGRTLGTVELRFTPTFVRQKVRKQLLEHAGGIILSVVALMAAYVFLLKRIVLDPVARLTTLTNAIRTDRDYSRRAPVRRLDEIGCLAMSVNAMLSEIEARDHQLQGHARQLEELVTQRTADLTQANARLQETVAALEQADSAKREFLANMSHEIRTPMNAIIGMSDLLTGTELNARQREYVQSLRASAQSLLALLNDVLDFSKIEAGMVSIEQVPFALRSLLDDLADIFRDRVAHGDVEFVIDVPLNIPATLVGDPLRLKQVLANLLANAFKFTAQGEVRLTVRSQPLLGNRAQLTFIVLDTGIGIPRDKIPGLFDAFTQADGSTQRKYGGTGLGLAICRKLVQLLGGEDIRVQSVPGQGSTFAFDLILPLAEHDVPGVWPLPQAMRGMRVLLVEDNPHSALMVERMLAHLGMQPITVPSAEAALEGLADETGFGAIIMDWKLPGMDGIEASRRLRAMPHLQGVPIIMISAFGRDREVRQAREAGVDGFLFKPVKQSSLFETLQALFGADGANPARQTTPPEGQSLAGCRILLVEDNPTNQQVAGEMLARGGAEVTVAGNGLEAVLRIKEQHGASPTAVAPAPFDVVLMDVQMPVMDGYSATIAIREHLGGAALPIIAMTAHAMLGDREKCLAAGMDDYVTKPINQAQLFAVLRKWLPEGRGPVPESPGSTLPPATRALLDLPGIRGADALDRLHASLPDWIRMLQRFFADHDTLEDLVRRMVQDGDTRALTDLGHSLGGAAGNLGLEALSRAARHLEQSAQAAHDGTAVMSGSIPSAVEDMLREFAVTRESFRILHARHGAPDQQTMPNARSTPDNLPEALAPLRLALQEFDPVRAAAAMENLAPWATTPALRNTLDRLGRLVTSYAFDEALLLVDDLRATLQTPAPPSPDIAPPV